MHVRTRFAPSPTGELHIGGARTALFSYLYAKHFGGDFLLRIEDTDRSRFVAGSEARILEGLRWLGIVPDEGPMIGGGCGSYRQSERLEIYREHIERLLEKGAAYYCFCSNERLNELRTTQTAQGLPTGYDGLCRGVSLADARARIAAGEKAVVRLKIPRVGQCVVRDLIRGRVRFEYKGIDDAVLLKSDGFPTYHLAAVVDDHLMEITHVFRSEEWLPSVPKHVALYEAFGWHIPEIGHVAFVVNSERRKLSKRLDGEAVWLETYRKRGYLPEAIVNYLVLLGWNPKTPEEIFSLSELIARFDGTGFNKAGAIFDMKKLDSVSAHYVRSMSASAFRDAATPFLIEKFGANVLSALAEEQRIALFAIEQGRVAKLSDIGNETIFVFRAQPYEPALLVWKKSDAVHAKEELIRAQTFFEGYRGSWSDASELERTVVAMLVENGVGKGDFLWPLRVALTGMEHSPSPFEALALLGREESLARIARGITLL